MTNPVCKRCGATLRFIKTRDRKAMPVEPVPDRYGNVAALKVSSNRYIDAYVVTTPEAKNRAVADGYVIFRPHFAACKLPKPPKVSPQPQLFEL